MSVFTFNKSLSLNGMHFREHASLAASHVTYTQCQLVLITANTQTEELPASGRVIMHIINMHVLI